MFDVYRLNYDNIHFVNINYMNFELLILNNSFICIYNLKKSDFGE
jgi:hypothetical protein